jgi:hypothetical protein
LFAQVLSREPNHTGVLTHQRFLHRDEL